MAEAPPPPPAAPQPTAVPQPPAAPRPQPAEGGAPSLGDVVAGLAFLVTVTAAWLYMAGWTYAYHYYDRFHVGLLTLDIPRENFFVYGFWVLRGQLVWVVALAVLGAAATLLLPRLRPRWPRGLLAWAGLAVVLLLFWLGYRAAVATAGAHYVDDRARDYPAHPRVRVWVDPAWAGDDGTAQLAAGLAEGCYRLLLQNDDKLFLFRPFKDAPAAAVPLVALPWGDVRTMRLLPDGSSCP